MMRTAVASIGLCVLAGVSEAQIEPLSAGQSGPHMVRAAGMPLNDGALPPGMLTVRVVEGGFTHDLADQVVSVAVVGGSTQTSRTGSDGRAQFAHLPVGAHVRARVTVGTEHLESDSFDMPATSGVRLLLVAGGADGTAGEGVTVAAGENAGAASANMPWAPAGTATPPIAFQAESRRDDGSVGVTAIRAVLATTTVLALGAVWMNRRPRRTS